jgi:hypothetical protein
MTGGGDSDTKRFRALGLWNEEPQGTIGYKSVCFDFLKGRCKNLSCKFSHKVDPRAYGPGNIPIALTGEHEIKKTAACSLMYSARGRTIIAAESVTHL